MKIKYIKKSDWFGQLTIGKTYDGTEYANGTYDIINECGYEHGYPKEWFRPLSEIRNETINKLLEDES